MGLVNHNKSVLGFNLSYMFHRQDLLREAMARVLEGFAAGALRMPAVRTYALEEVAQAHADLESGKTIGKLVLRV
jgi:NADPH:quinone reductase-like Zn-dependent oxidoreductase